MATWKSEKETTLLHQCEEGAGKGLVLGESQRLEKWRAIGGVIRLSHLPDEKSTTESSDGKKGEVSNVQ